MSSGESDALVAVDEWVIVGKRFHQCCGFLGDSAVVPDLWAEDGGLEESLIPESMGTAVLVDLLVMDLQDFAYGQVYTFRHLLGQLPIQIPEFLVGAPICFHHFRPHHALRGNHIVYVMLDGLLQ